MKLDQTFTVQADPDVVWAALTDPERVAPNLPGASITEGGGGGIFKGEFKVKLGPTTAAYNGTMKIEDLDQEARVATMSARGSDKRGNGGAVATIVSRVSPDGDGTRVDVETDFSITGKLARFGRGGMIQDVANKLLREFATNLQADLAGEGGPADAPSTATPTADAPTSSAPNAEARAATSSDAPAPAAAPPRPPAEPLDGGNLVMGVILDRLKTAVPALLLGLAAGFALGRRGG